MTKHDKALSCFKEAGFDFDIRHFDHRLMAQKLVYLLEDLGVHLGYKKSYNFYLRGTYSPALARDLFSNPTEPPAATKLSEEDRTHIARLVGAVELRPHMLEVMAAYRYLRDQGKSEDEALQAIKTTKPFISERDIAIGISKCKGLYPEVTQQDLEELEEEMAPWDAASAEDEN